MVAHSQITEVDHDDLPIDGEVLDERDLASEEDLMSLTTPDGVDGEWLIGELWKDLRRGEMAEAVLAEAEMRRVIELNRSLEHRFVEGAGQVLCRIPLRVAMHWIARYGHDFWKHRDSVDFFAARNPGMLIETKATPRITIDGFKDNSPATAAHAGAGVNGVKPEGAAQAVPSVPAPRVKGRRGRWAS